MCPERPIWNPWGLGEGCYSRNYSKALMVLFPSWPAGGSGTQPCDPVGAVAQFYLPLNV